MRARHRNRPELAPLDGLAREIQAVLDLVKPKYEEETEPKYDGYCGAASEAYLHLAGGRDARLRVMRHRRGGMSHWWLEDATDRVVDLTLGPADRRYLRDHPRSNYPYEKGRPAMFRQGYGRPSQRAAAIIELVKSRREANG